LKKEILTAFEQEVGSAPHTPTMENFITSQICPVMFLKFRAYEQDVEFPQQDIPDPFTKL